MGMSSKKNCAKCNKRHFKLTKVCKCGSSYFVSDNLVVSEHYKVGMSGNDLVRHLDSLGFSISQPVVLDRMKELGLKNEREIKKDKQRDLKEYLKTCKSRPSGVKMSKMFGIKQKTAYNIISYHFGNESARVTKRFNNSEQLLIDEYLNTYNKFLALPKSKQTVFERNKIVCEINTLKRYGLI
jgi:hypothetical protein